MSTSMLMYEMSSAVSGSGSESAKSARKNWKKRSRHKKLADDERKTRITISKMTQVIRLSGAIISIGLPFLLLLPLLINLVHGSQLADFDGATFYKAPVGSRIRIACNASHWNDNSVQLVLWFKGNPSAVGQLAPIYTIDARQKPLNSGQARHLVADAYKGRAKFVIPSSASLQRNTSGGVPYLDLAPIESGDQGEYRCRVDYRARPRENFLMILFVLVPPSSVEIMDTNGRSVGQVYGPLSEGADLTLVCLARGGWPAPAVTWRRAGGRVIDETYLTLNDFLALQLASKSVGGGAVGQRVRQQQLDIVDDKNRVAQATTSSALNLDNNQRTQTIGAQKAGATATSVDSINERERNRKSSENVGARQSGGGGGDDDSNNPSRTLEWLAWPEFNFFSSDSKRLATGSGRTPAVNGTSHQQQERVQELIELRVEETITTAVNVLHLTELSRKYLVDNNSNNSSAGASARLECRASNLHYDLRALIKMFAPPSLVSNSSSTSGPRRASSSPAGALAQSIERALWASLQALEVSPSESKLNSTERASSLRSGETETSTTTSTTLSAENWPALLEQQLARPHALASSSSTTTSHNVEDEQASVELSRNKLIALEAFLRPLDVKIQAPVRALSAGQVAEFVCNSSGSWPAARLSWLKNGARLEAGSSSSVVIENLELNSTSQSKLSLKLERDDYGAQLSCRAENSAHSSSLAAGSESSPATTDNNTTDSLGAWTLEDSLTLDVHYTPRVKLELGNKMLSEQIREHQDIFFVCQVDAQPPTRELTWLHNDRPINESSTIASSSRSAAASEKTGSGANRLIVSNNSLVLQRVQFEQRGVYACMAANGEGVGLSNQMELRVLHAPICVPPPPTQRLRNTDAIDDETARDYRQMAEHNDDDNDNEQESQRSTAEQLHLGRVRVSLNERRPVRCLMASESPGANNQVEFTWYLNNSHGERRVLFSSSSSDDADDDTESNPAMIDASTTRAAHAARARIASSQVNLNIRTPSDYGQLYCVARNSLGEQRRACVWTIEPTSGHLAPADVAQLAQAQGQLVACLAVNVTSQTAWIGCDLRSTTTTTITQVDQNNERPRNQRFTFNVLVFSLTSLSSSSSSTQVDHDDDDERQLEANLTSTYLDEPLFALVNLRPDTSYLLEIRQLSSSPATHVRLTTAKLESLPAPSDSTQIRNLSVEVADQAPSERRLPVPAIRQVTEPHRSDLVAAALISTRSTSASFSSNHQHHNRQFTAISQTRDRDAGGSGAPTATGAWAWTKALVERLFRGQPVGYLPADRKSLMKSRWLLDSSESLLICLAVLIVTLIGLLALHRLWPSDVGVAGSDSIRGTKSSRNSSASPEQEEEEDDDVEVQFTPKPKASAGTSEQFIGSTLRAQSLISSASPLLPPPLCDTTATRYAIATPTLDYAAPARYSTLDSRARHLATAAAECQPRLVNGMALGATLGEAQGVTRSRSSNQLDGAWQQHKSRLTQSSARAKRLISDANFSTTSTLINNKQQRGEQSSSNSDWRYIGADANQSDEKMSSANNNETTTNAYARAIAQPATCNCADSDASTTETTGRSLTILLAGTGTGVANIPPEQWPLHPHQHPHQQQQRQQQLNFIELLPVMQNGGGEYVIQQQQHESLASSSFSASSPPGGQFAPASSLVSPQLSTLTTNTINSSLNDNYNIHQQQNGNIVLIGTSADTPTQFGTPHQLPADSPANSQTSSTYRSILKNSSGQRRKGGKIISQQLADIVTIAQEQQHCQCNQQDYDDSLTNL